MKDYRPISAIGRRTARGECVTVERPARVAQRPDAMLSCWHSEGAAPAVPCSMGLLATAAVMTANSSALLCT